MKLVTVTLFNRDTEGEDHHSSAKNPKVSALSTFWSITSWIQTSPVYNSTKPTVSTTDLSEEESFDRRKVAREKIIKEWHCTEHSLPDKPVACWQDKNCLGLCFTLSMSNINFWASHIVSWFNYHHSLNTNDSFHRLQILMYTQNA